MKLAFASKKLFQVDPLWKLSSRSLITCSEKCSRDDACLSVSFNTVDNLCRGYDATRVVINGLIDTKQFKEVAGVVHLVKTGKFAVVVVVLRPCLQRRMRARDFELRAGFLGKI